MTDIVMPQMDGYQLCAAIRSDPGLRAAGLFGPGTLEKHLKKPTHASNRVTCAGNGVARRTFA